MKRKEAVLGLLLGVLSFSSYASGTATGWGYGKDDGPSTWGQNYPECSEGKQQSPIDIGMIAANSDTKKNIEFNYQDGLYTIHADGKLKYHLDELNKSNYLTLDGDKYYLKQLHFHTPSEHADNGELYPFAIHFVHQSASGKYAVLGVFGIEDNDDPINNLDQLVKEAGHAKTDDVFDIEVNDILGGVASSDPLDTMQLPLSSSIKYYPGSFTTPPCTEQVSWLVTEGKARLTKEAIESLRDIIGVSNNRPIQDINGRVYSPVTYK